MKIGSILSTLCFMILGAVFFVLAGDLSAGSGGDVGPGFFPRAISVLMIVCGIAIIMGELKKNSPEMFFNSYVTKSLLMGVISVAYVFLMQVIGFVLVTPVYIFAYLVLLNQKKMLINAAYSISITAAVYLVFARALNVRLAASFLGF